VQEFVLYDDVDGVLGITGSDVIVYGTPHTGNHYAVYTNPDVAFEFTVQAFKKIEIDIEVLCFTEADYDDFGFFWFDITEIVIREQCFFGDLCLKHIGDYIGSLYEHGGLQIDEPAIFELHVYKEGVAVPYSPFSNAAWWGEGAPLCIEYPDNLSIDGETFTVELWILVKVGAGFNYVKFHTWTFDDEEMIPAGTDGVVDFVLGNCNLTDPDLQLAPYMNLPATCGLLTGGVVPSVTLIQGQPGYFDVTLSGIGAGFDIGNGMYAINCFNRGVTINLNTFYSMNVYSSLYPQYMMGPCKNLRWDRANWIINHLANYPGYAWSDIQQAFWKIEDATWGMGANAGVPAGTAIATNMYNDCVAYGNGFVPLPGGWAGVAFEHATGDPVQCIFLRVDP
jgi:hypothetical protein